MSIEDDKSSSDPVPDGTADQFRDVDNTVITGADSWITSPLITDDGTDGGVKRTVAVGDRIHFVFRYQTFTAGDSLQFSGIIYDSEEHGIQLNDTYRHRWPKKDRSINKGHLIKAPETSERNKR